MNTRLLNVQGITKNFGKVCALDKVSFTVSSGEILAVVGESGSGKTTLIRLITGLETLDEGSINIREELVSSTTTFVAPEHRNVGMVFQDYALFPHFTVCKNIAYGISKQANKAVRVAEMLALVGLEGFEERYPHELSGGQQQRVALARALAPAPELLILDEPFSNLDVILRHQLREDIAKILRQTKTTAIFVTHDIKDALAISDTMLVLQNGIALQHGKTKQVFENPATDYVQLLFDAIQY